MFSHKLDSEFKTRTFSKVLNRKLHFMLIHLCYSFCRPHISVNPRWGIKGNKDSYCLQTDFALRYSKATNLIGSKIFLKKKGLYRYIVAT